MHTRTRFAVPACLLALLLTAGCVRHGHDPARAAKHLTKELELDAGQQARVARILEGAMAHEDQVMALRRDLERAMADQLRAEAVDQTEIAQAVADATVRSEVLYTALGGAVAEIHGVLTPEQRARLAVLMEKHEGRRHRHHR